MTDDGSHTATVDRIVEGIAVCLIEADGEVVDEHHLDADELPDGCGEGTVLELDVRDGEIVGLTPDPEETEERCERAQSRFDRLSRRPDEGG